jgi:hypothetical protein
LKSSPEDVLKMPKYPEGLVENQDAAETKKYGKRRISLKLDGDGQIKWDDVSEEQKADLIAGLLTDSDAQTAFKEVGSTVESSESIPTEFNSEHIGMALDLFSMLERIVMPTIIKYKTKGAIKIPPEIASEAFRFTDDQKQKLGPSGAQLANQYISQEWKDKILKVGPGAEFGFFLFMCVKQQTETAIELYKKNQPTDTSFKPQVEEPTSEGPVQ